MSGRRLFYCFILAGLCLLLVGCGGPQNPLQFQEAASPFWNGLWDGLTILVGLATQLVVGDPYGVYNVNNVGVAYNIGYVLGAGIFFSILYTVTGWGRD